MRSLLVGATALLFMAACTGEVGDPSDPEGETQGESQTGDDKQPGATDNSKPVDKAPAAPTTCDPNSREAQPCTTASGESGFAKCEASGVLGVCGVVKDCKPADSVECFPEGSQMRAQFGAMTASCALIGSEWRYPPGSCSTPLVLSFDGKPVEFTQAGGHFDLGAGLQAETDWVSANTPWLALDVNGNGQLDDGRELFGSMTILPDGTRAENGFIALAALDDNADGWLTIADSHFSDLLLWRDLNQDRKSSPAELESLRSSRVVALQLQYAVAPRCSGFACEMERAQMLFQGESGNVHYGNVIDVHFAVR